MTLHEKMLNRSPQFVLLIMCTWIILTAYRYSSSLTWGEIRAYSSETWLIARRLAQNSFLDQPIRPFSDGCNCDDQCMGESMSVVMTAKDTCSQVGDTMRRIDEMLPASVDFHYAFPDIVGCTSTSESQMRAIKWKAGRKVGWLRVKGDSSPTHASLALRRMVRTPLSLLIHNDAYPLARQDVCELIQSMKNNSDRIFSAPQLFEISDSRIPVPHGHLKKLTIRGGEISSSADLDLMTRRNKNDFVEGPQPNFVEDHAVMTRTGAYHLYMDEKASFTLEHVDVALSLSSIQHPRSSCRLNPSTIPDPPFSSSWHVPYSFFEFDVSPSKMRWEDVPYFVYKRSDLSSYTVRQHMSQKWNANFRNTATGLFLKSVYLGTGFEIAPGMNDERLKDEDHFALFLSWFEAVGFNSYSCDDSQFASLTVLSSSPRYGSCVMRRKGALLTSAKQKSPSHVVPFDFSPIHVYHHFLPPGSIASCVRTSCSMVVQRRSGECSCFQFVPPFHSPSSMICSTLLIVSEYVLERWFKLPSRAILYAIMISTLESTNSASYSYESSKSMVPSGKHERWLCPSDANCSMTARFERGDKLLRWRWI